MRDLKEVADKLGCTLAAARDRVVRTEQARLDVITGASRVEQVHENMKALDVIGLLDDEVMERIDMIIYFTP